MGRLLLRRVVGAVPLLLAVAVITFALLEAAPGSVLDRFLGQGPMPPEVRQKLIDIWGLDQPPQRRFLNWFQTLLSGDLGFSLSHQKPVVDLIGGPLANTLILSGLALLLNLGAGTVMGVYAALHRDRPLDRWIGRVGLGLYAMPAFWVGVMAILLFSVRLGWFPAGGVRSPDPSRWPGGSATLDLLWHAALPALVLGLASAGATARFIRSGLLTALGEPFVRAARARGLGGVRVIGGALRTALVPVVNLVGLSLPVLVSGTLVIEATFDWNGMGWLAVRAVEARDAPLILACTLLAAAVVIVGNLLADVAIAVLDPRVATGEEA